MPNCSHRSCEVLIQLVIDVIYLIRSQFIIVRMSLFVRWVKQVLIKDQEVVFFLQTVHRKQDNEALKRKEFQLKKIRKIKEIERSDETKQKIT